jgi:DNA-directed RNA polymerase subunit RPC12/RpoP
MNELKFQCPECKQSLEIEASAAGTRIECPACNQPILVPTTPEDADAEADGGLLGFIEQMLRRMIWGIFRFVFLDSPLRIWRFLVQTFPWFIRLLRVAVYGLIWAILSFWPFLALRYVPCLKSEHFSQMVAFTTSHQTGIKIFGYIWAGVCLAGSLWGIIKWTSQQRSKARAK